MKLQKGQKVWLVFPAYSPNECPRCEEAEVVKASSKWATVTASGYRSYVFKRTIWEKEYDNRSNSDTNYPATLYESESAWNEERRKGRIRNAMAEFCRSFIYNKNISTEQIEKILEILEIKVD